jgi:molybdopterin-containing oxidoreductase family membrane subunit
VHSIVSCDFAVTFLNGWHSTLFPPYFVVGAIFGGCAMVLTLLIPLRFFYPPLHELITNHHLQSLSRIVLFTGSLLGFVYAWELFLACGGAAAHSDLAHTNVLESPLRLAFLAMVVCNVLVPQLFWWKGICFYPWLVWIIAQFPHVGMWLERFVIIPGGLMRGPLPSSWGSFQPTWVDILCFAGTVGLFISLFLLFVRWVPLICMHELKTQIANKSMNEFNFIDS